MLKQTLIATAMVASMGTGALAQTFNPADVWVKGSDTYNAYVGTPEKREAARLEALRTSDFQREEYTVDPAKYQEALGQAYAEGATDQDSFNDFVEEYEGLWSEGELRRVASTLGLVFNPEEADAPRGSFVPYDNGERTGVTTPSNEELITSTANSRRANSAPANIASEARKDRLVNECATANNHRKRIILEWANPTKQGLGREYARLNDAQYTEVATACSLVN